MPDSPEWSPPSDPGEFLAWLKNFTEKLPLYADKLGVTPEQIEQLKQDYQRQRAAKEITDNHTMALIEQHLCQVPNGWPAPDALAGLLSRVPFTDEPMRTRMLEDAVYWTDGIKRANSVAVAPVLRGGYFDRGIVVHVQMPEQCTWWKMYYREKGRAQWHMSTMQYGRAEYFHTDPEEIDEDEDWRGSTLEFVAIAMVTPDTPQECPKLFYGAPSNIVAVPVPTQHPVSAEMQEITIE